MNKKKRLSFKIYTLAGVVCFMFWGCEMQKHNENETGYIKSPRGMCTTNFDPVCGEDGKTYFNRCDAKKQLKSVKIVHEGVCGDLPENNIKNTCKQSEDCRVVQDKELSPNAGLCVHKDQLQNARYNQEGNQEFLVASACACQNEKCQIIPKKVSEDDPMMFQGNCYYTGAENDKLDFSVWKTHCASQIFPDFDTQYLIDAQEEKGWIFDFYFPILCKPCDTAATTDCFCPPATEYRIGKNAQAILKEGYDLLDTSLFCSKNPWWIKNNCEKYFYALKTSEEIESKMNPEQYYWSGFFGLDEEEKIESDTPINFCTKNSDCVLGETGIIIKRVKCITLKEKESKNIADPAPENLMTGGYCGCQENKCNDIGGIPTTDCLNCS